MLPYPSHHDSVTGNDRIMMGLFSFQNKIFKGGCKNEGLMQYKCMEKEIRKLHGRILFPSVMYIANIPAGMQLWQIGSHESLYTGSRFPSPISRGPGKTERILQIRKKASQSIKNTDTIPCSMSPHSRTTSSRRLQDFPVCSALAPDFGEALIHSQSLLL